jgi:hypothetical protein
MPALLRWRMAVAVMFGIFLIPVGLASLRGLTHVLVCQEQVEQPFEVIFEPGEGPILTGSTVVRPDSGLLCDALTADLSVVAPEPNRIDVTIPITNSSSSPWRGTVQLVVGNTQIPVSIGLLRAGETHSETLRLRLPDGTTAFDGSILIGP